MADQELPPSIGQAVVFSQVPEERAKLTEQGYRNVLESAILDVPAWAEGVQFPFLAGELIPVRVYLALTLAGELRYRPLHASDLAEAIHWYRQAEPLRASAPRTWAMAQHGAGLAWLGRSDIPRPDAVASAVAALEQSLEVCTPATDAEEWAATVVALGDAQREIEPDGASVSVTTFEAALAAAPPGLPSQSQIMLKASLAASLIRRGDRSGSAGDLDRAVTLLTGALDEVDNSEIRLRASLKTNLGYALGLRSERGWSLDWSQAVQVLTEAVELWDRDNDPGSWAEAAGNLGIVLKNRPDGDRLANLKRARKLFEDCVECLAQLGQWWNWAAAQNNLGTLLLATPGGDVDELSEAAVAAYENARRVWTRDQHPLEWALTTARLGGAVERQGGDEAAAESLRLFGEALDGLDRERNPVAWARVSNILASAEQSTVSNAAPTVTAALTGMLRTAIGRFQDAADVFTVIGNRFDAASSNHNRGLALAELAGIENDPSLARAALDAFHTARELRSAREVPWDWATTTLALADLHAALGERLPAQGYYREALDVLRTEGESQWVLRAAAGLGRVSGQLGDWREAGDAFRVAMGALDELYAAATLRSARERALAKAGSTVVEAAYAVAASGDLPAAVEVLEHGRGRLLADAMQRRRDPYVALAASHPADYQAYRRAVAALEVAEAAALRLRDREDLDADDRYRRAAERDTRAALRLAREQFAAANARLAASERDLGHRAGTTVAYLMVAASGAVALVSGRDSTRAVWAPDLRAPDVQAIVSGDGAGPGLLATQQGGGSGLDEALQRALPVVARLVAPLAADLAAHGTTDVCLVACGSLALLPLHAVRCGGRLFGDLLTISYAPSAAMLADCERALVERHHGPASVLAVSDPLGDLRFGRCEATGLLAFLPGTTLEGAAATREEVRRGLRTSTLVHFACHGRSVPDHPLRSHLVLADGELSLLDLSVGDDESTAMPAAVLVVASACQTALVEGSELPDEYLGLSSGFLMAGVPGYIGTLWPADDIPAALTSIRLYELLYPADGAEALTPARALQDAQRWLRSLTGRELVAFADRHPAFRAEAAQQLELAGQMPDERLYDQLSAWAPQVIIGAGAAGHGEAGR